MRDFRPQYCVLLKNQVEDELKYLREHGHNTRYPLQPCIFCTEYKNGFICSRIEQLNQFLSEIMVKINMPQHHETNPFSPTNNNLMPLIGFSD